LLDDKEITPKTEFQKEVLQRYSDISIARAMGCSLQSIWSLPQSYYNDISLILGKEAAKQKAKQKQMERQMKMKQGR